MNKTVQVKGAASLDVEKQGGRKRDISDGVDILLPVQHTFYQSIIMNRFRKKYTNTLIVFL